MGAQELISTSSQIFGVFMRVLVILNPSADVGHGIQKKELIEEEGKKRGYLELIVTEDSGHATELSRKAAENGYDLVAAAGGDGTIHEVVNGLVQNGRSKVNLGIIPIGSGNDFAYGLGIPNDVPKSLDIIFGGCTKVVDLGAIKDDRGKFRLFNNNLGVGFDANVVIRVEEVTKLHGFAKYFWGVLKTLILDFQPFHFRMRFDDESVDHDALFVTFGNGTRHGGGFMLTPDAKFNDNLIDTCTVWPIGRLRALMLLNSAVKGTHINLSVVSMRKSETIEISCERPLPIHIDGEVFAQPDDGVRYLQVSSIPAAIKVAVNDG